MRHVSTHANLKTILACTVVLIGLTTTALSQIVTKARALTSGSHQLEAAGLTSRSTVGQTPIGPSSSLGGFALNAGFWSIVAGETVGPVAGVVAVDDTAATTLGQPISIEVTLNDINPVEGPLRIVSVTQPASGTAAVGNETTVQYTPNNGFFGEDQFTYRVANEAGSSDQATVRVTVEISENGPTFVSEPETISVLDRLSQHTVKAVSQGGERVDFDAPDLPTWLELNETSDTTASLEGTPGEADLGDNSVTILAGDGFAISLQSFTITVVNQTPAIPELVSPEDGEVLPAGRVTWEWRTSDGAASYRYQFSRDSDFADLLSNVIGIPDTTWRFTINEPGTYYWRIGADNPVGFSGFSVARSFVIGSAVSTESPDDVPEEFELRQNYPNPFNPATSIVYHLPQAAHVHLAVYDVFGREVRVLVDRERPAGSYTLTFDASRLASGAYLYRISAEGWVEVRTLVVLK